MVVSGHMKGLKMDLTNRKAKCADCTKVVDSNESLAFFEFQGEGSRRASDYCGNCGMAKTAHISKNAGTIHHSVASSVCDEFEPRGAMEFDNYYCGCRGWD